MSAEILEKKSEKFEAPELRKRILHIRYRPLKPEMSVDVASDIIRKQLLVRVFCVVGTEFLCYLYEFLFLSVIMCFII